MKNKGEQGSVTLFVVGIGLLVMLMLMTFVINVENKKQAQDREIDKIMRNYQVKEQDMEKEYLEVIKQQ